MELLKQELDAIDRLHNAEMYYLKTLALLRALKRGAVQLSDIKVTADGWSHVAADENTPAAESVPCAPS